MRSLLIAVLLSGLGCSGQQQMASAGQAASPAVPQEAVSSQTPTIAIPAETRILMSLVRPVSTRTTKVGDKVHLQTSAPVMVDDELAIPVGTSVEGTLATPAKTHWAQRQATFQLRSVSLILANGYTASVPGTLNLTNDLRESTSTYGDAGNAAAITAIGAAGGGTAVGALANGVRGAAIGGAVGGVAGAIIAIALAVHHGGVFMDVGTSVDTLLESPLTLEQDRVLQAARQSPPPPIRPHRPCYEPGSPETPDTVIPGTPGTSPTVIPGAPGSPDIVIPGTPGTPDTIIPGTPATPGRYYPCPQN